MNECDDLPMSGNFLSANLGSRGVGVITGADGIKPGVGSETNFPQNSFCAFLHTFFSGGAATTFGTGVHANAPDARTRRVDARRGRPL